MFLLVRSSLRAAALALLLGGALLAFAGSGVGGARADRLTVFAASSLTGAFEAHDPGARYSFGSSGTLETQIRLGAPADLFASASPRNTQRLFAEGLVDKPVVFASNRLALIVPRANPAGLRTVADLRSRPVRLVIAGEAVPAGAYAVAVLGRLGLEDVLAKVVSREPDVKAVTAKVALGQADAGLVYATDVRAVSDKVLVIPLPARAQPDVRYEIAVVGRSPRKAAARAWIRGLLSPRGQAALRRAGFLPVLKEPS
ncbi:MAG: molybdate ABC transporter substrate-binding protein [Actinobacteria bacterium]|nr:molybdate ABC transporter substrate-binding protein [Actinomycetota bacterium]